MPALYNTHTHEKYGRTKHAIHETPMSKNRSKLVRLRSFSLMPPEMTRFRYTKRFFITTLCVSWFPNHSFTNNYHTTLLNEQSNTHNHREGSSSTYTYIHICTYTYVYRWWCHVVVLRQPDCSLFSRGTLSFDPAANGNNVSGGNKSFERIKRHLVAKICASFRHAVADTCVTCRNSSVLRLYRYK